MTKKDQILDALSKVKDPELNKSLVELNMIRRIEIQGKKVSLEVVLTIKGCPLKNVIQEQIENALRDLGYEQIELTFGSMTEQERLALSQKLQQGGAANSQQSQETRSSIADQEQVTFIAIASGKGGVGKSTVTANLAVALVKEGKRVGLIDADIYGFSIPDMMGIEERPTVIDKTIYPVKRFGVQVMSMAFFVRDNAPVIWRGPRLRGILTSFLNEVDWGELDYLLIDLPPGTGDVALDVHQMIPQSKEIIVTTPHATAAYVAARAGTMAIKTDHQILGVVENMSWYEAKDGSKEYVFGRGGGERLAQELGVELLAQIPLGAPMNDIDSDDFSPSIYMDDHPTARIYRQLAQRIIALQDKNS
jgi:ATP-binding protein involved in chromosome partitioning